jgi:hypothetical protein
MRIFATDPVVAKSRFWYFLRQLRKFKKTTGEIVSVQEIRETKPLKIKERPEIFFYQSYAFLVYHFLLCLEISVPDP